MGWTVATLDLRKYCYLEINSRKNSLQSCFQTFWGEKCWAHFGSSWGSAWGTNLQSQREHAGKVSLQFAFFLHFSQNICYRPLQKWDSGMEGSLVSPYSNTMITQYAPSIAWCMQEGENCGSASTQQRDSTCILLLDAWVRRPDWERESDLSFLSL